LRPSPTAPALTARPPLNPPIGNTGGGFKDFSHIIRVTAVCGRRKTVYSRYIVAPILAILEQYPSREEAFIKFHIRSPRDGYMFNWTYRR
jgi:hypothetical protein